MMKMNQSLGLVIVTLFIFSGCSTVKDGVIGGKNVVEETVKVIWGSSTRAIENARADALTITYACRYQDCFDYVLSLANNVKEVDIKVDEAENVKSVKVPKYFEVFIKDISRGMIVVMGVDGHSSTTEVGIFLSMLSPERTKIEVTSLSETAKAQVAQIIWTELDKTYTRQE